MSDKIDSQPWEMSLQYPRKMESASRIRWSRTSWCAMLCTVLESLRRLTFPSRLMGLCFDSSSLTLGLLFLCSRAKWLTWQSPVSLPEWEPHRQQWPYANKVLYSWKLKYVCRAGNYRSLQGPSWDTCCCDSIPSVFAMKRYQLPKGSAKVSILWWQSVPIQVPRKSPVLWVTWVLLSMATFLIC